MTSRRSRVVAALRRARGRAREDERGGDTIFAILFIMPLMMVLTFALVDIGVMFADRFAVTNVLRDAARGVAAYGSDGPLPWAPPPANTISFSEQATRRLWNDETGKCRYGPCQSGERPQVVCGRMDEQGNLLGRSALAAGDTVGCRVVGEYPYKSVTGGLLDTPLGLGLGGVVSPFPVWVTARAETGLQGNPNVR